GGGGGGEGGEGDHGGGDRPRERAEVGREGVAQRRNDHPDHAAGERAERGAAVEPERYAAGAIRHRASLDESVPRRPSTRRPSTRRVGGGASRMDVGPAGPRRERRRSSH